VPEENVFDYTEAMLEAAIDQAVTRERERCARIAEHLNGWGSKPAPLLAAHIAKVIRQR
jgi:hypothetical protein